ncbi:hypothetical protein Lalb_Chr12g0198961 [Lupinus albus]|uniref:Uncharacterized protein n=1 Tax=Lupinus albus TaxID=3870 RepID=A0A6A4PLI3_LUPAL|nr:hypothetical protein Lalb_Chr12g0198961 [Lupinus albus]
MIFVFIHRWKLLDFAKLKHSSISFIDIEKHETAISHVSQAITRAAKVGKSLSKDDKVQNLALQQWLEAVNIGEGRKVNLEKCPPTKLQQQCFKYLGPVRFPKFLLASPY